MLLFFLCGALCCIPGVSQEMSAVWKFESQRKEIEPAYSIDAKNTFQGKPTLTLSGGGKEYADGHWYKVVNVEAGQYFQFQNYFKASQPAYFASLPNSASMRSS